MFDVFIHCLLPPAFMLILPLRYARADADTTTFERSMPLHELHKRI